MQYQRLCPLLSGALGLCLIGLNGCAAGESPVDPASPGASALYAAPEAAPSMSLLRAALTRSAAGVQVSKRPDGITRIDVTQGFQNASVVAIDPDGRHAQRCIQSPEELDRMLTQFAVGEP
jgi:hypothetical protein